MGASAVGLSHQSPNGVRQVVGLQAAGRLVLSSSTSWQLVSLSRAAREHPHPGQSV